MHTLPNLPPSVAREVFANLCATLPPPATDTTEAREMRDNLAMSAVAALHPADAFEALLAVTVVVADFYASDCLRLATEHRDDYAKTMRCRAQACAMMRQMQRVLRTLEQMQAARNRAAEPAPTASQRPQATAPHPDATPAAPPDPSPQPDALAQAEAFAVAHPVYAAQIRFDRGLTPANTARIAPADLPTDPAVIEALVSGTSDLLAVLDEVGGDRAEAA
jgi:hypothetical protein